MEGSFAVEVWAKSSVERKRKPKAKVPARTPNRLVIVDPFRIIASFHREPRLGVRARRCARCDVSLRSRAFDRAAQLRGILWRAKSTIHRLTCGLPEGEARLQRCEIVVKTDWRPIGGLDGRIRRPAVARLPAFALGWRRELRPSH